MENVIVKSLNTHRDLLFAWTTRIIKARYQQSVLGGLWAVLQPAAQVFIFSIIFTQIISIDTRGTSYVLFSFVAMVPWTFFINSINDMVNSLTENMNLVTKVYFPREIFPVAALLARFVDFLIASVMLIGLMIYYRAELFPAGLLFLPVIIIIQMMLALGIGLIGSSLNVFYRDIKHIVALGMQLWFYASPILYPIDRVPEQFRALYFLNPMAGIITAYRSVLVYGHLPDSTLWISAGVAVAILAFGYWLFKRVEFQFADVV